MFDDNSSVGACLVLKAQPGCANQNVLISAQVNQCD
jgi:hypothetical protein